MIDIDNVSIYYNNSPVLKDISVKIQQGEFVAIIGPNGAGKTTLLKLINGLLKPDNGTVRVSGQNPVNEGMKVRKKTGFIFQNESISEKTPLSVMDVVEIGRSGLRGIFSSLRKDDYEKITHALGEVGIEHLKNRPAGLLSGGEKRKVSIARELSRDVNLLLLDEILTSLDPASQVEINRLIGNIYKNYNLTVIFVTHLLRYLPEGIGRIIALKDGRKYFDGIPSEVNCSILSELYNVNKESLRSYVGDFKL